MLTIKEAERAIVREWDAWAAKQTDALRWRDGMLFFQHLQRERPDLLQFRYSGDKWQRVHGWLISNGRVTD